MPKAPNLWLATIHLLAGSMRRQGGVFWQRNPKILVKTVFLDDIFWNCVMLFKTRCFFFPKDLCKCVYCLMSIEIVVFDPKIPIIWPFGDDNFFSSQKRAQSSDLGWFVSQALPEDFVSTLSSRTFFKLVIWVFRRHPCKSQRDLWPANSTSNMFFEAEAFSFDVYNITVC